MTQSFKYGLKLPHSMNYNLRPKYERHNLHIKQLIRLFYLFTEGVYIRDHDHRCSDGLHA